MKITADDFDEKFDAGEDISGYLDLSRLQQSGKEQKRVNVDFPAWMVQALDRESSRLGVPRQALIKFWIAERLEKQYSR